MRSNCLFALILALTCLVPGAHASSQRFVEPQQVPLGGDGYGIVLADFNGDGITDLAVTLNNAASVAVLLGTGTGFGPSVTYTAPNYPSGIAVADFNRDGKLDMVVTSS
ncbi:MAG: VCBS repeat-containing protein, partial [Acidobacteriales bacterium]|nr:VCBS repeat-containing protein [Terriglobales bacterium]